MVPATLDVIASFQESRATFARLITMKIMTFIPSDGIAFKLILSKIYIYIYIYRPGNNYWKTIAGKHVCFIFVNKYWLGLAQVVNWKVGGLSPQTCGLNVEVMDGSGRKLHHQYRKYINACSAPVQ